METNPSKVVITPKDLIDQVKRVYEASGKYYKAKADFEALDKLSKNVFAAIKCRIEEEQQPQKVPESKLERLAYADEDWKAHLHLYNETVKEMYRAKVVYEKHDLLWQSYQSSLSFMKVEAQITRNQT